MLCNNFNVLYIVFCLVIFVQCVISNQNDPVVNTAQGIAKGTPMVSKRGLKYAAFLGIPFAKPPVGPLRLMPPLEAEKWEGVRDATKDAPPCVQQLPKLKNGTIIGNEDCLYVNVYTPLRYRSYRSKLYPVMVWIYGGGFMIGSATSQDFSPYYLMDKDVVLVTINYRLGNFGFLSLEDNVIAGNYGLKDQREALRWVKKYISGYNGNPEEVTIFGQSAGGVSTALHVISPLSRGLFKKAISQSGTALSFWSVSHKGEVRNYALRFIKEVRCHRHTSKEILKCLQSLSVDKFLFNIISTIGIVLKTLPFDMRIVREPSDAQEPFLVGNPWDEITKPNNVTWILGANSADGNLIVDPIYSSPGIVVNMFRATSDITLPRLLGFYDTVDYKEHGQVTKSITDFYFGTLEKNKSKAQFINMFTDRVFIQPAIDSIRNYPGTTYFYFYDHVNRQSKMYNGTSSIGATHSDELYSLFYFPAENATIVSGIDAKVSDQIIEYWTTFAASGTPNSFHNNLPYWSSVVNIDEIDYLYIRDGLLEMRKNLRRDAYELWRNLPIARDF